MSRKEDLIRTFKEYKEKYESMQMQAAEINKNTVYTPEGRERLIVQLIDSFTPTVSLYHDKAANIIDTGLMILSEKWKENSAEKLTDGGYQAGLTNVIKILEMGVVGSKDDIQNIIDVYKGDYNALAVIREILYKSKDEEIQKFASLVPGDNRGENKRLLSQLHSNVDKYINVDTVRGVSKSWNAFNHGMTSVSSSMDSMSKFVQDRLGDNLELLN